MHKHILIKLIIDRKKKEVETQNRYSLCCYLKNICIIFTYLPKSIKSKISILIKISEMTIATEEKV